MKKIEKEKKERFREQKQYFFVIRELTSREIKRKYARSRRSAKAARTIISIFFFFTFMSAFS